MASKKKSLLGRVFDSVNTPAKAIGALVEHFAEHNRPPAAPAQPIAFSTPTAGLGGTSIEDLLRAGQGVGTPLQAGIDYAAGGDPNFGKPAPANPVDTWLSQALASLGGGPDRNAYIAPFDQATQRANEAYAQATPNIAATYDTLRQQLGAHQQDYQAQAQQTQANQAASAQSIQDLLAKLQAPVAADLQAQGGQAAVGSLTGGLQASMAAGQAGIGNAAAAQQQLSQNLSNAGNQSFNNRIEDTRVAEQGAQGNASANLNSILNQIGLQKAGAEGQYNSAAQQFAQQRSGLELQALQAKQGQDDPLAALQLQKAALENQKLQNDLSPDTTAQDALQQWHLQISAQSPVAYDYLSGVLGNSDSLAQALAQINRDAKGGDKIKYGGKSLDAATLRQWASEATRLEAATSGK